MFSIKGVYKDQQFHLEEPLHLEENVSVIVTFLESASETKPKMSDAKTTPVKVDSNEEHSEEYYEKLRKHKRYKATGNISIVTGGADEVYPLNDYSAGGLSFMSDRVFESKRSLTASLKDPIEKDVSVLDFEFEVVRVIPKNGQFLIGCKFFDDVDEELWHSLMS